MVSKSWMYLALGIVLIMAVVGVTACIGSPGGNATPTPETSTTAASSGTVSTGTGASSSQNPFDVSIEANKTFKQYLISVGLMPGVAPVDMSKITVNAVVNGKTYSNIHTFKPYDWVPSKSSMLLEQNDTAICAIVNCSAYGIPADQPGTVVFLKGGSEIQSVDFTPV